MLEGIKILESSEKMNSKIVITLFSNPESRIGLTRGSTGIRKI